MSRLVVASVLLAFTLDLVSFNASLTAPSLKENIKIYLQSKSTLGKMRPLFFHGSNNLVFAAKDTIEEAIITCEAKCPVQWYLRNYNFETYADGLRDAITFSSSRTFTQFNDTSSYAFSAKMVLKSRLNRLTGQYYCKCIDKSNSKVSGDIFVYWEGSSAHYLLQAGERTQVSIRSEQKTFRIHCGVSAPDQPVYLFIVQNRQQIDSNNQTVFKDKEGFTLDVSIFDELAKGIKGKVTFMCTTSLRRLADSDVAYTTVGRDDYQRKTVHLENFLKISEETGGLVNYNYTNHDLICCSRDRNHRQVGFYCLNHQQCQFRSHSLISGHNANEDNSTCSWYHEGFGASNGAVVFRCERPKTPDEEGLQANAEKFYGLNSSSYLSMKEAEKEKENFVKVSFEQGNKTTKYLGSEFTFECKFSNYLFSDGNVWMVESMEGGTFLISNDSKTDLYDVVDLHMKSSNIAVLKIHLKSREVSRIVCLVPLYSSYEWWNSTFNFHEIDIKEPIIPRILGSTTTDLFHDEYEQVAITCESSADPKPEVWWTKDSVKLLNTTEYSIEYQTNTMNNLTSVKSTLVFKMNQNTSGRYVCHSSNVGGKAERTFHIKFPQNSITVIVVSTITVIALLLVILAISFWKIRKQKLAIMSLTIQDIQEFEKGNPEALAKSKASNDYSTNQVHHLLPYNTDFEVTKDQIYVDHGSILGQGMYGMVLKGRLKAHDGTERPVAVKTIKPNEEASHFKVLLCEVKIMAYIGQHENIVSLVGAFTRNIRNREIYVATEFCEEGNLLEFLRKNRSSFKNLFPKDRIEPKEESDESNYTNLPGNRMTSYDLLKWCEDVSQGMEYLASKRIIHGDLACRNVLLDINLVAKVGDFGLSKHLFQYTTYQKKTVQLLPWKWMAIESLEDMEFSLQSDIWAFGVTAWEIFTLGKSPYPGFNWDEAFMQKLVHGYRLNKPEFSNSKIYEVMLSCWIAEYAQRPSFSDLKVLFRKLRVDLRKIFSSSDKQALGLTSDSGPETTLTLTELKLIGGIRNHPR